MVTANFAAIAGLSLIAVALVAVFFSPYRRWLGFMLAGMFFWGLLEVVRFGVQVTSFIEHLRLDAKPEQQQFFFNLVLRGIRFGNAFSENTVRQSRTSRLNFKRPSMVMKLMARNSLQRVPCSHIGFQLLL